MSTIDLRTEPGTAQREVVAQEPPVGDPSMIGVPTFVIGSIALALTLTGFVPAAAQAAALPIIIATTGIGQLVAAIWAARLGQSAVACVFAVFCGFWLSYSLLLLGLSNAWYGIVADDVKRTVTAFLLTWVIAVALLTVVTLRLPMAFTVLFALIDLALVLVMVGNIRASTGWTHAGGYVVFGFAALGAYLFAGAASAATGGRPVPLGDPVLT
jgi:succinate-acetate transporter protein